MLRSKVLRVVAFIYLSVGLLSAYLAVRLAIGADFPSALVPTIAAVAYFAAGNALWRASSTARWLVLASLAFSVIVTVLQPGLFIHVASVRGAGTFADGLLLLVSEVACAAFVLWYFRTDAAHLK